MQRDHGHAKETLVIKPDANVVDVADTTPDSVIVELPNGYQAWTTREQAKQMVEDGEAIKIHEAKEVQVRVIYKDKERADEWMSKEKATKLDKIGALDATVEK